MQSLNTRTRESRVNRDAVRTGVVDERHLALEGTDVEGRVARCSPVLLFNLSPIPSSTLNNGRKCVMRSLNSFLFPPPSTSQASALIVQLLALDRAVVVAARRLAGVPPQRTARQADPSWWFSRGFRGRRFVRWIGLKPEKAGTSVQIESARRSAE